MFNDIDKKARKYLKELANNAYVTSDDVNDMFESDIDESNTILSNFIYESCDKNLISQEEKEMYLESLLNYDASYIDDISDRNDTMKEIREGVNDLSNAYNIFLTNGVVGFFDKYCNKNSITK